MAQNNLRPFIKIQEYCSSNKMEESIDWAMKNFLNSLKGIVQYIYNDIFFCEFRFQQYAVNQKISHKNYRESLGIIGIESLSFMCDRMFNIMDKDKDGYVRQALIILIISLYRYTYPNT